MGCHLWGHTESDTTEVTYCFHVLAIINSAAMNIGVHVSLSILFSLGFWMGNTFITVADSG